MRPHPLAFVLLGALALLVPRAAGAEGWAGVPVLMYHHVNATVPHDPVGADLTVTPANFEAQLRWLHDRGIRTLTTRQLVDALRHGEHPEHVVVLTFDDGYSDAATVATPLLRKYGDVASFYVSAGFIGDGRHADWKQLRAMRAAGMEIGCHGTHHLDLSTLDRAGTEAEAGHCAIALAHYLARPTTYAYAAGKWKDLTIAVLREHGFLAALTERPGVVTTLADPYALQRRRVRGAATLSEFAAVATP
jgi:peptidoglycan/xylan/chitin deacetylase (PgdA/CDA1 family)